MVARLVTGKAPITLLGRKHSEAGCHSTDAKIAAKACLRVLTNARESSGRKIRIADSYNVTFRPIFCERRLKCADGVTPAAARFPKIGHPDAGYRIRMT